MSDAQIIEVAENLKLESIATVQTARGREYLINMDKAVEALADLFCDLENEAQGGWSLGPLWYANAIDQLKRKVDGTPKELSR